MNQNKQQDLCKACSQDLKAYLDAELPFWRRWVIESHLSHCETCQRERHELERIAMELKKNSAVNAVLSPHLRERLLTNIQDVQPDTPERPKPFWQQKPLLVFGGGGATVAASILVFASIYGPAKQAAEMQAAGSSTEALIMYTQDYNEAMPVAPPVAASGMSMDAPATAPMGPSATAEVSSAIRSTEADRLPQRDAAVYNSARARVASSNAPVAPDKNTAEFRKYAGRGVLMAQAEPSSNTNEIAALDVSKEAVMDQRKVHREASLTVAVDGVEATSAKIEDMVRSVGGYIASNNLTTDASGYKAAEMLVKVPVDTFDKMMSDLSKLGDVRAKNVTGEDITEQVSDATSDEQVLVDEVRKLDERLKAGGMSEKRTAQTEAERRQVRLQLARTRARLGLLRRMSDLSTLQISLVAKAKKQAAVPEEPGFLRDLRETNRAAMTAFQAAVRVPIVMVVWVLAFSPLWVPLILAYRYASLKAAAREKLTGIKTAAGTGREGLGNEV